MTLRRLAASVLVVAMMVSAISATSLFESSPAAADDYSVQAPPPEIAEIIAAVDRVPSGASTRQAAAILFPDDAARQRNFMTLEANFKDSIEVDRTEPAVAFFAALVPILTRCVLSAGTGAIGAEVVNLARHRRTLEVEAALDAAIAGCIVAVVPPPLKKAAMAARAPLVSAIAAIIIRHTPLA